MTLTIAEDRFADLSSDAGPTARDDMEICDRDDMADKLRWQRVMWTRHGRPVVCRAFGRDITHFWGRGPVALVAAAEAARVQELARLIACHDSQRRGIS